MKKLLQQILNKMGYALVHPSTLPTYTDIKEQEFWDIYNFCKPYTMTSIERIYSLYNSVNYVLNNDLKGDFVECGVWRGGSSMLIAKMLKNRNITTRKIFLYDTFEGMSAPRNIDKTLRGEDAKVLMDAHIENKETSVWCLADLEDVKRNLKSTGFQEGNLVFVKGKVEDTLPAQIPDAGIALLRLDTDWYESTKHELKILFPLLEKDGILIIDDYGHWEGCRKAVDEYFTENKLPLLLNRIDYTGRLFIKNF